MLVENAQSTKLFYVINPFEAAHTQFFPCKYPKHTYLLYQLQQDDGPFRIGDRIRYARARAGYTQKKLAELLGIDRITLIRQENNQVSDWNMKTELLVRIAEICGFEQTFCCDAYHRFIANNGGAEIKAYRKRNRMTQQNLANMLGVNKTTIKRWEKNRDKPSPDKLSILFPDELKNLYYLSPVGVSS